MSNFAKTYWGIQFLNALNNIDYSNRLPRGRRYAANGAVVSINIDKNIIKAKVAGTRPSPYNIHITVPKFTDKQKNDIINIIKNKPTLLAELFNRRLPDEFLQLANNAGVQLFPKTWRDFDMKCSCPDWAVPCKHLAAVIYILASEIDLNPFKVLEIHDFDILKELSNNDFQININTNEKIESWDELFVNKNEKKIHITNITDNEYLNDLDFTLIPDYNNKFLDLLSDNTPFSDNNFKNNLLNNIKKISKRVNDNFSKNAIKLQSPNLDNCLNIEIIIDNTKQIKANLIYENDIIEIPLANLFYMLDDDNVFRLPLAQDNLKIFYYYFQFAKKIIEQGAIVPKLIFFNNLYHIFWQPLLQDDFVKQQLDILNKYSNFINIIAKHNKKLYYLNYNEDYSFFLTSIINTAIINDIHEYIVRKDEEPIMCMFFGNTYQENFINKEVLNSIQIWLNKINSDKRKYIPVLKISEDYPYFNVDLYINNNVKDKIEAPLPFHKFVKNNGTKLIEVTKDLMQLQDNFPEFNIILNNSKTKHTIKYNSQDFSVFLLQIIPILKLLGVEILLPKSLKTIVKPATSFSVKNDSKLSAKTYMDLLSVLNFEWKIAVGNDLYGEKDFLKLVQGMEGIVKLKNNYIHVNKEELNKLLEFIKNGEKLSKNEMLRILLADEYNGEKIKVTAEVGKVLNKLKENKPVPLPDSINAVLRPYQIRGYEWLYKNSRIGFGSILADDMGLGKTLQTIVLLQKFKDEQTLIKHKALIIVPTTIITNWEKEIQKFAPTLKCFIYHGNKRNINDFKDNDILITSYGTVRSDKDIISEYHWRILIIDEAQNIKNHNTAQTKAIKSIKADIKIALSGTPVENRLSEYWSIFDFTNHGYLGSAKSFNEEFAKPITLERSHKKIDVFKKITSPFIMRRMKNDKNIINDLPDKIEINQYCSLTKDQAALYESTVQNAMDIIANSTGIERKGLVLKMMIALKQIGNHPFQYLKTGANSANLSGKMCILFDLLDSIIDNNEKVLIFTQYKEMGDLLQLLIKEKFLIEPLFLHGSVPRKKREQLIEDFQTKPHRKIFILSLKAGGTGLNLTQAQNVIHYDLWWNPAVENQATDRAYRIGQDKKVVVHRLINKGTLEERIDEMIRDKKELANLTVSSGEKWLGELNNKELLDLVKLSENL